VTLDHDVAEQLVRQHTVVAPAPLCPEVQLHLVTEECALFAADEETVKRMGMPEPFWAFCWAGGDALARFLLDHPEHVCGRSVLAFGAGGGVEAIAAARSGATVCAADTDPIARAAASLNARLNGVSLSLCDRDLVGMRELPWEVVLVGDVCYEESASRRILAWLADLARSGVTVLLGDPHRGFVEEAGVTRLASYSAPADNDRGGRSLVRTSVFRLEPC
jgi:predicted nicotinamide N-methyase